MAILAYFAFELQGIALKGPQFTRVEYSHLALSYAKILALACAWVIANERMDGTFVRAWINTNFD